MGSKKIHYKMYKAGKRWLFASIVVVSFGLGSGVAITGANADSTSSTSSATSDTSAVSTSKASSSSETTKTTETSESSSSDTTKAKATSENTSSVETSAAETSESSNNAATSAATTSEDASSVTADTSEDSSATSTSQSSTAESTSNNSASTSTIADNVSSSNTSSSNTSSSNTSSSSTSSNSSAAVSSSTESTTNTTASDNSSTTTSSDSKSIQVSYTTLLDQLNANAVLESENDGFVEVTKDNFLKYFKLNGSATYDATTGIVTLTPDENNKVGNFSLNSEIAMNTSFTLTGSVNLGSDPNGADGIGFAFHTGNTDDIGNAGGNLGIGGLQNAIGFKLDTWNNGYQAPNKDADGAQVDSTDSNGFGWNGDSMNAPYGTFVTTSNDQIATADGKDKVQRWWAVDEAGTAQSLSKNDINGQFHDFVVTYNGTTRLLTINYTQTDGTVLTWSTTVDSSYEAMAMVVSASTGGAKNLQQFKIDSFDFQQAATVNVTYVDQKGNVLATDEVTYPSGPYVNGTYTTEQKDITNYKFIGLADGKNTTTGLSSIAATGDLTANGNNGTVVYVYAPDYKATSKTINETINYVDQKGNTVATSSKADVTFVTVTNPVDGSVTYYYKSGAVATPTIGNDGVPEGEGWTQTDSGNFAEVVNPTIAGYKVISNDAPDSDLTKVSAQNVTNNSSDMKYTVVYAPDYQATSKTINETINYIDQKGNTVSKSSTSAVTFVTVTNPVDGSVTYYYKSGAVDTPTIGNDGVPEGDGWTKASSTDFVEVTNPTVDGYKVISNDAPDSDLTKVSAQNVTNNSSDMKYTVVYAPDYQATSRTINETINYIDQNGKTVADTYKAEPITFVTVTNPVDGSVTYYYKSGAVDTPTISNDGVPEGDGWTKADNKDFGEVANPSVTGYEVISNDAPDSDLTKVATQQVTANSSDLNYTVVYKLKEEKATVKYIDDTTNTILTSKDLSGAFGSTDDYRTADTIKYYENKGYVLVSDNYPSDGVVYDQDGVIKNYEVHLVHGTTPINPDNPQEPGEPINPNDPDSPKWPDGTDKDSLTKTVTETVHYKYEDGTQAAPDKTDSVTFEHEFVIDNVTGEIIKDNGWKAVNDDTTFDTKVSPTIDGYTADKKQIDEITGLTQNSADVVETVIYKKNAEPIIPDEPVTPVKPETPSDNGDSTNSNTPTNSNSGDSTTTTPLSNVTTKSASAKKTLAKVTVAKASLPQTGDEQNNKVSIVGAILIALASIGTLFGLGKRNKENQSK